MQRIEENKTIENPTLVITPSFDNVANYVTE
jgi:hypothetical protein